MQDARPPPACAGAGAEMPTVAGSEQQQIGMRADRDAAAIRDAVKPGLMARQTAHAFREVERAAFAHPMAKEIKPEARIA